MSSFPFSRTASDSVLINDIDFFRSDSFSGYIKSRNKSSPFCIDLPHSSQKLGRSFSQNISFFRPADHTYKDHHNLYIFEIRSTLESRLCLNKYIINTMDKENTRQVDKNDSIPFSVPAMRSHSAIFEDKLRIDTSIGSKTSSYNLALRRPPARFSGRNPTQSDFSAFQSLSAVRSTPVSRHNSDEINSLLRDLDFSDEKEVKKTPSISPEHERKTGNNSPLSPIFIENYGKSETTSPITPSYTRSIDDILNLQPNSSSQERLGGNNIPNEAETNIYGSEQQRMGFEANKSIYNFDQRFQDPSTHELLGYRNPNQLYSGLQPLGGTNFNRRRNITSVSLRNSIPCRYFQFGYCARGSQCHYSHSMANPMLQSNMKFNEEEQFNKRYVYEPYTLKGDKSALIYSAYSDLSQSFRIGVEQTTFTSSLVDPRFENKTLDDFVGEIYLISKDQNGCRFLQKVLEDKKSKEIQMIFEELREHFPELMLDPFGNYLCQKFIEVATLSQITELLKVSSPMLARISLNLHGTRVVQKLIGYLDEFDEKDANEAISILIESFKFHVVSLIKDLNGNHVVQKCVNKLSSKNNQFIYDSIVNNCIAIATHKHGCCVIQRCFDRANDYQRDQLVIAITQNALSLVQDPFGNYVVQHVIDLSNPAYNMGLIKNFFGHVCHLSVQKFSSNVIEKCIVMAEGTLRHQLINEIMCSEDLEMLIDDSFANYVVQTCLDYAEHAQREILIARIRPILLTIKNSPHIKGLQSRILAQDVRPFRRSSAYDLSPFSPASKIRYQNQMPHFGNTSPYRNRINQTFPKQNTDFNFHKDFKHEQ